MFRFFRRKPKIAIENAIMMVSHAVGMVYICKRDSSYLPTEAELRLLGLLEQQLFQGYTTVQYIIRCLNRRAAGEPESAAQWQDKDTFDYHYPP